MLWGVTAEDLKDDLRSYLRQGRDVMLGKLDGLSEYDVRRPLVRPPAPTCWDWSSTSPGWSRAGSV
ncbi:hypothetical protein GCM10009539_03990 [Cryptosporangium japonicum]|uniref:Uncharacterized protein n=1 Tax=Cryptosporangium japonicum TaxID=80872 RepID=A0ABN0THU7_9ACTN